MSAGEWWGTAAVTTLWLLLILSLWWRDRTRRPTSRHVHTDPVCVLYREPRTAWARRRYDRARGRACMRCLRGYGITDAQAAELNSLWTAAHGRCAEPTTNG